MIHVAVDGPSGAGKGTICGGLAIHYGGAHFDAGSIYRALVFYLTQEMQITSENFKKKILNNLDLGFDEKGFYVEGRHFGREIRTSEMTMLTAQFNNQVKGFKPFVLDFQKSYVQDNKDKIIIGDGRDLAQHVMPNADLKIYFHADANKRAERRLHQLEATFPDEDHDLNRIVSEILSRDEGDYSNPDASLMRLEDALKEESPYDYCVDSGKYDVDGQFHYVVGLVDTKLNELRL